ALHDIEITVSDAVLRGYLEVPPEAKGLVIFAHGSGSSRKSSRNQYVARHLREAGVGTLLFDLLTAEEEEFDLKTRHLRFDIPLLAGRLRETTEWMLARFAKKRPLGYFGASTGAAAALIAAAVLPNEI